MKTTEHEHKTLLASLDAVNVILRQISRLDQAESQEEMEGVFPDLLRSLGEYTLSDRAYLFDWATEEQLAFRMTHEWCRPGVRPTFGEMQNVEVRRMPVWIEKMRRGEPIVSMDWDEDGKAVPEEFALFDGQDIHALIVLPIFCNHNVNGYIGLDNPDQAVSALSLEMLRSVGGHIGSLKENRAMLRQLEEKQARLEQSLAELNRALTEAKLNNEIIGCISQIYWLIYRMDLVNETYEEISAGEEVHRLTGNRGKLSEGFADARAAVVSAEDQAMMKAFLDVSTLPERMADIETTGAEYRDANGLWHLVRFIAKKRDERGRLTSVLYLDREINQQKQKEMNYRQKMLENAEEARRANLAKTDFLRRMSHDIRTPINAIRGMMAIADHCQYDTEKQKDCRDKVMEASGFLLDLVNSVLDMNKLESGEVVLEHKPFDLLRLLEETDHIIAVSGENMGIPIESDNSRVTHRYLIGSPLHLRQILQNVTSNAVKYNRRGGTIHLSCQELGEQDGVATFRFTCRDTGRGMSQEFVQHAFEPFTQEEDGARTSYMGTGLGLSIAKELTEQMGGTIHLESQREVGTNVELTLPFIIDTAHQVQSPAQKEETAWHLEGVHVLVVEDNDLNLEIAKFLLEHEGMIVTAAQDGQEAVNCFLASAPGTFDLILMDIMMPTMDGLEATRSIRALDRPDAKTIPIFAMTANAFPDDVALSKAAGMNEHLTKPLKRDELLRMIQKYL